MLQFAPRYFKLFARAVMVEAIQAHILHQNIQAVHKRPRGRDSSTFTCVAGEDMPLLEYRLRVMLNHVTAHITEVIRRTAVTGRALV